MVTSEERMKILKMIQEGTLTAEQGMQLLESLQEPKKSADTAFQPNSSVPGRGPRWFRVCVTDTNTGKVRVNVRLPVNVITAGAKMGARFSPEVQGLDMEELMNLIRSGEIGKIVDVFDEKDGEHVEVYLE
jgi:hypothetical protein